MSWIAFGILLYLVTVVQTALVPFLAVQGVRPDLMIILAVFYALSARSADALIACWIIGLAMDLTSQSYSAAANVGVSALTLGLVSLLPVALRDLTFRDSAVTQLLFTFLVKLLAACLVGLHLVCVTDRRERLSDILWAALYAAIYTAILAPYVHGILHRLRGPLGIGTTRRLRVG